MALFTLGELQGHARTKIARYSRTAAKANLDMEIKDYSDEDTFDIFRTVGRSTWDRQFQAGPDNNRTQPKRTLDRTMRKDETKMDHRQLCDRLEALVKENISDEEFRQKLEGRILHEI
jgi:hypothetical protein